MQIYNCKYVKQKLMQVCKAGMMQINLSTKEILMILLEKEPSRKNHQEKNHQEKEPLRIFLLKRKF